MRRKRIEEPASFTDEANAAGLEELVSPKAHSPSKVSPKRDEYDADAKTGTFVPLRRWLCVNRANCKGRVKWTGWEQVTDRPVCPDCGGAMHWHQWLGRQ